MRIFNLWNRIRESQPDVGAKKDAKSGAKGFLYRPLDFSVTFWLDYHIRSREVRTMTEYEIHVSASCKTSGGTIGIEIETELQQLLYDR